MDISRELISLKRRALEHQVKENKPTLRMVFFDEVKDSIEVIPPYETPINFEELRILLQLLNYFVDIIAI